jgi:FlgN protein
MSRLIFDLESILQQLIVEHRKLLKHVDAHQAAMKTMALDAMDQAANQQEASRLRIVTMESTRRTIVAQLAQQHRISGEITIPRLAILFPQRGDELLKLRDELKKTILQVQARSHIAGRLAGALLGHLNTVVRLIVGAVERAGVYTKTGAPKVSTRIGVMEAVG